MNSFCTACWHFESPSIRNQKFTLKPFNCTMWTTELLKAQVKYQQECNNFMQITFIIIVFF